MEIQVRESNFQIVQYFNEFAEAQKIKIKMWCR